MGCGTLEVGALASNAHFGGSEEGGQLATKEDAK